MTVKFKGHVYCLDQTRAIEVQTYLKTGKWPEYYPTVDEFLASAFWLSNTAEHSVADWVYLGEISCEFKPAPENVVAEKMVASLRNQINDVKAEAENKITQMTKRLNELLAITM